MVKLERYIEFLLKFAPPNILYRTKKEILKEPIDTFEMLNLQQMIQHLPKVRKAYACQRENGFLDLCCTALILTVLILL